MKRFSYLSWMLLPGVIGLACFLSGCSNQEKAVAEGPVRVDVKVIGTAGTGNESQNYSGTVEAADASTVSFSVPGTITKIYVKEGQQIAKGQLIAKIKSESLTNSRNIAQAELEQARDTYQRLKKLHDANALPDIKWVEIQSKLKQAQNAAALADRAVNDASIYSPISGYVAQKFADDGQNVIPAQPIVKVVDINNLQIAISVPENEIASFGQETTAVITFDVADTLTLRGKINRKSVVADPLTRSYTVKFDIEKSNGAILPGMIGSVSVNKDDNGETADVKTVTLPSQAVLLSSDNKQFVWMVRNGKAVRQEVVADELSPDGVTVKSGLSTGDSVIVAGMQKVSTGTPVTAVR